mmetsp:Transcript_13376/g.33669  ORF Transcript_13376/g.33669 Transcript_13376/m.33669 type:complete len:241 (-) Transcript_13376:22-744(-)
MPCPETGIGSKQQQGQSNSLVRSVFCDGRRCLSHGRKQQQWCYCFRPQDSNQRHDTRPAPLSRKPAPRNEKGNCLSCATGGWSRSIQRNGSHSHRVDPLGQRSIARATQVHSETSSVAKGIDFKLSHDHTWPGALWGTFFSAGRLSRGFGQRIDPGRVARNGTCVGSSDKGLGRHDETRPRVECPAGSPKSGAQMGYMMDGILSFWNQILSNFPKQTIAKLLHFDSRNLVLHALLHNIHC